MGVGLPRHPTIRQHKIVSDMKKTLKGVDGFTKEEMYHDNKKLSASLIKLKEELNRKNGELSDMGKTLQKVKRSYFEVSQLYQREKKRKEGTLKKKNLSLILKEKFTNPTKKYLKKIQKEGLKDCDRIFQNLYGDKDVYIKGAMSRGDWKGLEEILGKERKALIDEIKTSGLRGRGGAGFPSGVKASFMPKERDEDEQFYLVINADESEPGSCKDREVLRHEPHKLIEGAVICSYMVNATVGYIYIRGEFFREYTILKRAIAECYKEGFLGKNIKGSGHDFDLYLHRGSGAYICGEETALLESLEGKPGRPRLKPPYPAQCGLYQKPTAVYNVETIASMPTIIRRGGKWFSSFGRDKNHGTKIFCVSGDVNNPLAVEEKLGIPLKDMIMGHAGGVVGGWDNLLAVIPGGGTACVITKEIAEKVHLEYDHLANEGTSFGTGGIIVWNKDRDIIKEFAKLLHFYRDESCGKCTLCREGTYTMYEIANNFAEYKGTMKQLEMLGDLAKKLDGQCFCPLGDAIASAVAKGFLKHFKGEFIKRIKK